MFNLVTKKASNVKQFIAYGENLLLLKEFELDYKKRNVTIISKNGHENELLTSKNEFMIYGIGISERNIWINPFGGAKYTLRYDKEKLNFQKEDFFFAREIKKDKILVHKDNRWNLLDENKQFSFLWQQDFWSGRYIENEEKIYGIHAKTNNKLRHDRQFCIDIETGEISWEYQHPYELDAEKSVLTVIGKIIGTHNGKVYLKVKGEKYELEWTSPVGNKFTNLLDTSNLVVLDAETGNVETIQPFPFYKDRRPSFLGLLIPSGGAVGLDKKRNRIVILLSDHYFEMDLEDYSIKYWDMEEEFKPYVCTCVDVKAEIFGDHLFFLSNMQGNVEDTTSRRQIAALNLNTKKIDWEHTFKTTEEIDILDFKITGEKLYVLWGKELHIFEKP